MRYEILDESGNVVNTIVADAAFMESCYSGRYREEQLLEAETDYREKRAAEYPPMTDYLDGIVKGDQAQVQAYIEACLAVKTKYPKP